MSPALLLVAVLQAAPQSELLDFTAEWCSPCQQMSPLVEQLRREGYPVRQVDVDRHRDIAKRFNITSIPAFVLVVNGREVDRRVGSQSEASLKQLLAKIPPSAPDAGGETPAAKRNPLFPLSWGKEPPVEPPAFSDDAAVRAQSPEPAPAASAPAVAPPAARDPIQTAVRIRVKDARGVDLGSGTIIASRPGQAIVLTCWHIFREFGKDAAVEVDFFPAGPAGKPLTLSGRLIDGVEEADVALVSVSGCGLVPVSPIAGDAEFPETGDLVFSVGCDKGDPPTKRQHHVTRLNPYDGPDTTECDGMPLMGRSGGGLFDAKGQVIGVCFAADREDQRGVYAGPAEIHELLKTAKLAVLIPAAPDQIAEATPAGQLASGVAPQPPGDLDAFAVSLNHRSTVEGEAVAAEVEASNAVEAAPHASSSGPGVAGASNAAALAAIEDGAEVICTIRSSGAPTEVIIINRASRTFLRYLRGELESQPIETAMRVPTSRLERSRLELETLDVATNWSSRQSPQSCASSQNVGRSPAIALLARVFHNRH